MEPTIKAPVSRPAQAEPICSGNQSSGGNWKKQAMRVLASWWVGILVSVLLFAISFGFAALSGSTQNPGVSLWSALASVLIAALGWIAFFAAISVAGDNP